jgi:hypothetical protein
MTAPNITPELVADFLDRAKVEVVGDNEFIIEFEDGRTYLLTAEEMQ